MASNLGDLNGSGPFYVRLDVNYSGTQSGNSSLFNWAVYVGCFNNGWGTYGASGTVSVNIGGNGGTWGFGPIDFRPSGSSARAILVAVGSTWVNHNSDGTRPGFENFASIDSDHSSIGDGGVGGVWVDAPTIGSPPSAPGNPTFSEIGPTSLRVSWAAASGSNIDSYLLRRRDVVNGSYVDVSSALNLSRVDTGLTPGKSYVYSVYAHNDRGFSPQTAQVEVRTLSGAQINVAEVTMRGTPFIQVAGVPRGGRAFLKTAAGWKPTS